MKRNLLSIWLTVLLMLVGPSLWADDVKIDGIYYEFLSNGRGVSVTYKSYSNNKYISDYSGSIVIPSTVTYKDHTYSVAQIGQHAFDGCTGLESITIPNNVTYIGYYAFKGCTGLKSITIPNSVTEIGQCAFYGCTGLKSITIPNSVTKIDKYAFKGCI